MERCPQEPSTEGLQGQPVPGATLPEAEPQGRGFSEKSKDQGVLRACIIFNSFFYLILLPPPSPPINISHPTTLSGLRFQRT